MCKNTCFTHISFILSEICVGTALLHIYGTVTAQMFSCSQKVGVKMTILKLSGGPFTPNQKKSAKNRKNHKKITETTDNPIALRMDLPMFAAEKKALQRWNSMSNTLR